MRKSCGASTTSHLESSYPGCAGGGGVGEGVGPGVGVACAPEIQLGSFDAQALGFPTQHIFLLAILPHSLEFAGLHSCHTDAPCSHAEAMQSATVVASDACKPSQRTPVRFMGNEVLLQGAEGVDPGRPRKKRHANPKGTSSRATRAAVERKRRGKNLNLLIVNMT